MMALASAAVLTSIGLVGYRYLLPKLHSSHASVLSATTQQQINIPIFYPNNLPSGYVFNHNEKAIKANVLYFSITDPRGEKFYVTEQPLPTAFNFNGFTAKFLKPDQYTTNIGTVIAGPVGNNLIASIRTNNNVWIIVNSTAINSLPQLETITRSFTQSK